MLNGADVGETMGLKFDRTLTEVANALEVMWAYVDKDLVYRHVSQLYCKWWHTTEEDLVGKSAPEFMGQAGAERFDQLWSRVLAGEQVTFSDYIQFPHIDTMSFIKATYMPYKPEDEVLGFYVLFQDKTEENQTITTLTRLHEITAQQSLDLKDKIQAILRLGCDVFELEVALVSHVIDNEYTVDFAYTPDDSVEPGTKFELGNTYCVHTLKANGPLGYHHAGESEIANHPCYQTFGLESYIGVPLHVSDELYGTLNFSSPNLHERPFSHNDFELIRLFAQWIGNELTRRDAVKNIARQGSLLAAMSNQARIGAWEVDLITGSIFWSDMTKRIHEVPMDFVPDMETAINFYKEGYSRDQITKGVEEGIATGKPWHEELQLVTAKGNELWVAAIGQAEYNSNGEPIRLYGSFQDIDERVKNSIELKKAKEEAEAAAKLKSEFLANMSHEIRTPMNGVLGMINAVIPSESDPKKRYKLELARSSADSLLHLINDILDFSKVDAGKLDLEIIEFNILDSLKDFCEFTRMKVHDKKLDFNLDFSGVSHPFVKGDPNRLRQILNNLVGNAIKFTERGAITIKAFTHTKDDHICFHCSVTDSGIGIEKEKQDDLFKAFTQADASTTRNYGGTGLGLAIVVKLCELMGGRISVDSDMGKGSTFTFEVLMLDDHEKNSNLVDCDGYVIEQKIDKPLDNQLNKPLGQKTEDNCPILLVEDNLINQVVAKELLSDQGLHADIANNGLEALAMLKDNGKYQVILMDCQMPELDGYEATKRIRAGQAGQHYQSIPIIALTAHAMKGDKEKCLNAGMSDYVSKPIDSDLLTDKINQYLHG